MKYYETYKAHAGASAALTMGITSPFVIEVRFLGGLTPRQQDAFAGAADRWSRIIVGDVPSVVADGEIIDDVVIVAEGRSIDGIGRILGQAGPTRLRPATGPAAFLPAKGIMRFDTADLQNMEQNGTLNDVITHEMGHVLGIGTIWREKGLLLRSASNNPVFTGPAASVEFGRLRNIGSTAVPVADEGGPGTVDSHWRERIFNNELMSGSIAGVGNPISRVTVASLQDLGYVVDINAAEPFALQSLSSDDRTALVAQEALSGIVLPNIPTVLPASSMQ